VVVGQSNADVSSIANNNDLTNVNRAAVSNDTVTNELDAVPLDSPKEGIESNL
jgi:hypothetical protein